MILRLLLLFHVALNRDATYLGTPGTVGHIDKLLYLQCFSEHYDKLIFMIAIASICVLIPVQVLNSKYSNA